MAKLLFSMLFFEGYGRGSANISGGRADLNQAMQDGTTPLHAASHMGHLDVVKYLVEAGVGLNPGNNEGGTPLALARQEGHKKVVAYLERSGVSE